MNSKNPFITAYPNLTYWVESFGWLEMGADEYSTSLIRILDIGGMIWEREKQYDTLDVALQDADTAVAAWFKENGVEDAP